VKLGYIYAYNSNGVLSKIKELYSSMVLNVHQMAPSQIVGIWWHGFFQHWKSFKKNYHNFKHVANNVDI